MFEIVKYIQNIYWNIHSNTWDEYLYSTDYANEIREIVNTVVKYTGLPSPFLADIGCATGSYSIEFAKQGFSVLGIDYAKKMIEKAKTKINEFEGKNVSFISADYTQWLDSNNSKFDFILFAHINISRKCLPNVLIRIKNALKESGCLILVIKKKSIKKKKLKKNNKIFIRLGLKFLKKIIFRNNAKMFFTVSEMEDLFFTSGFILKLKSVSQHNHLLIFEKKH